MAHVTIKFFSFFFIMTCTKKCILHYHTIYVNIYLVHKQKFYETILFLSMMHTVVISNLPYSVIFSFLIKCWPQPFIIIPLLTSQLQPTLCKSAMMSMITVLWQHTHTEKEKLFQGARKPLKRLVREHLSI